MGLFFGIFLGVLFGVALMAGWERMMRYRSRKRIAKVCYVTFINVLYFLPISNVEIKLMNYLRCDQVGKWCLLKS